MTTSQNGYPANDQNQTITMAVAGTKVKLRVRQGVPGQLLTEYAKLFDNAVEDIDTAGSNPADPAPKVPGGGPSKVADDWAYAERNVRGSADVSNHASGTAIDLNATQHPLGVSGTYTAVQLVAIHAILREFADPVNGRSVLRAGEDYQNRKDGMHVEIVASQAAVVRAWAAYVQRHAPKPTTKPVVRPVRKPAARSAGPVAPGARRVRPAA